MASLVRALMRPSAFSVAQSLTMSQRAAPVAPKKGGAKKKKKRLHQVVPNEEFMDMFFDLEEMVEKEGVPEWFEKLVEESDERRTGSELTEEDGHRYQKYQKKLQLRQNNKARSKAKE